MGYLYTALFIVLSSRALACPNEVTLKDKTVVWKCSLDQNGNTLNEKRTLDTKSKEIIEVDFFKNSKRPFRRDVYKTKFGVEGKYFFKYLSSNKESFKLSNISLKNFDDSIVFNQNYKISEDLIKASINSVSKENPKVVIIDSGFNFSHPDVFGKHFVNTNERLDKKDSDGDGLVDNMTIFNGELAAGNSVDYKFNINQLIQLPTVGAPFSHGSFVASIAMKDINTISFLGAGGDIFSVSYLYKILEQINKYDIRFSNMSFGFGDSSGFSLVGRESIEAVEGIIRASYNTLHIVASGNGSRDFDEIKYSEYPACLRLNNKITVGALKTADLNEEKLFTYETADFSNIGVRCVDIMAPGVDMKGAGLGSTYMKASGTSVSSPFVLNVLLKMYEINNSLTALDYKKILLKTSYVPKEKPFKVRSGGLVFPKRALMAVSLVSKGLDVDKAIWASRDEVKALLELEDKGALSELWRSRGIL